MNITLAYGKHGLPLDLPDDWPVDVVAPRFISGLSDPAQALTEALRQPRLAAPLGQFVRPGDQVGIIFSDITRPTPNKLILPAVLAELAHIPQQNITLFNACGTHRANTDAELRGMLGDGLVDGYSIVQNNAFAEDEQVCLGVSSRGHEIWLNRKLANCDVKILTGFIEPHFFAGFSGGGKAIMPGMGGLRTILGNHDTGNIGHPQATWGITHGNPIWEEVREAALLAGRVFLLNVTLNRDKQITAVFAGELDAAHAAGCEFARETAMARVPQAYDIVVTTNSGYPLDLNLYQTVKGMSAAAQVVRPDGAIIAAAECWDGIPDHGSYGELLRSSTSPRHLLARILEPGFLKQDQWQAQIQAMIQVKAEVHVYSDGLSDEQIRSALFIPCRDIPETLRGLRRRYGSQGRICILPEGPQTIPYLA
jgi:lactate racemase